MTCPTTEPPWRLFMQVALVYKLTKVQFIFTEPNRHPSRRKMMCDGASDGTQPIRCDHASRIFNPCVKSDRKALSSHGWSSAHLIALRMAWSSSCVMFLS